MIERVPLDRVVLVGALQLNHRLQPQHMHTNTGELRYGFTSPAAVAISAISDTLFAANVGEFHYQLASFMT